MDPNQPQRTFLLNGQVFFEGDILTVTVPELGTVEVRTALQSFSHGKVVGLDLHWVIVPSGCTAKLSLYSNGVAYHTIQLAYHCPCAMNVHPRSLEWFDVNIDGHFIEAGAARSEKQVLIPFRNIERVAEPIPEPEVKTNSKGQIQLF